MAGFDLDPPLWPESVLNHERPADNDAGMRWWVLHVRPRTEKTLARKLRARRAGYYLPLHERHKTYQRRVVTTRVPMFSSYVFAYGDDADYEFTCTARETVSALRVIEQETLLNQLRDIQRLIDSGAPITAEERLEVGMPARIIKGPLAGMSGQVVQNKRGLKFVLQVQFIQRAASIEVDGSVIEAL